MQAFATQQDVIDLYGARALEVAADRDNDGQVDPQAVDRALVSASATVRAYELRRTTPVVDAEAETALQRQWAVDIGLYLVSMGAANTDEYRRRRDDAVAAAKDFYQPAVNGTPSHAGDAKTGTGAAFSANSRRFSRDSLEGL